MVETMAKTSISLPENLQAHLDALALRMEMDKERTSLPFVARGFAVRDGNLVRDSRTFPHVRRRRS